MAETIRLNKVLRELNISIDRAVDFLESKRHRNREASYYKNFRRSITIFLMSFKQMLPKKWPLKKLVKQS